MSLLIGFAAALLALHLLTIALVLWRLSRPGPTLPPAQAGAEQADQALTEGAPTEGAGAGGARDYAAGAGDARADGAVAGAAHAVGNQTQGDRPADAPPQPGRAPATPQQMPPASPHPIAGPSATTPAALTPANAIPAGAAPATAPPARTAAPYPVPARPHAGPDAASGTTDPAPQTPPGVTLLRPVCGLEYGLAQTLESGFRQDIPGLTLIHCIDDPGDPALPLLRRLMARYPQVRAQLLIGRGHISGNPKLNNLVKGWAAAPAGWVVMADSNLLLPPDYLRQVLAHRGPGVGMVSSPAFGTDAQGLWARVEAGFLNSYQARWQLAADSLGLGFAQGKTLAFARDWLNARGGLAALAPEMAEDVAATKTVRAAGLRVAVTRRPFAQPLGRRAAGAVWQRQARWARLRRDGFAGLYLLEPLTGPVLPGLALAVAAPGLLPGFALAWYGAEWLLAQRAGWPGGAGDVLAWGLRDALLLPLWLTGWRGGAPVWRGNAVGQGAAQGDTPQTHAAQTDAARTDTEQTVAPQNDPEQAAGRGTRLTRHHPRVQARKAPDGKGSA
ncbi:ceramide glucosyltransferase [Paracoccus jiaweipingae]|uniref:ceramide glucosyltransferase n=1 Tax=unclassified Paracoccus (in: a-proteobacteria) TaxID=2688777 RepID=UPI00379B54FF